MADNRVNSSGWRESVNALNRVNSTGWREDTYSSGGSTTTLTPSTGNLTATGYSSTLTQPNSSSTSTGNITVSGYAPTLTQSASTTLTTTTGNLTVVGYLPTLIQTTSFVVTPTTGSLTATGYVTTLIQPNSIYPVTGSAVYTGYIAGVQSSFVVLPATGSNVITGQEPTVLYTCTDGYVEPGYAWCGYLQVTNNITPTYGSLLFNGYTPTVTQSVGLTDSEKIDLILDLLANRQELDPVNGTFTVYADNGITVLKTALAWEDADGTIPYRGNALRRIDALV